MKISWIIFSAVIMLPTSLGIPQITNSEQVEGSSTEAEAPPTDAQQKWQQSFEVNGVTTLKPADGERKVNFKFGVPIKRKENLDSNKELTPKDVYGNMNGAPGRINEEIRSNVTDSMLGTDPLANNIKSENDSENTRNGKFSGASGNEVAKVSFGPKLKKKENSQTTTQQPVATENLSQEKKERNYDSDVNAKADQENNVGHDGVNQTKYDNTEAKDGNGKGGDNGLDGVSIKNDGNVRSDENKKNNWQNNQNQIGTGNGNNNYNNNNGRYANKYQQQNKYQNKYGAGKNYNNNGQYSNNDNQQQNYQNQSDSANNTNNNPRYNNNNQQPQQQQNPQQSQQGRSNENRGLLGLLLGR